MSWLKSAVNKAVEVRGGRPISRTVKTNADTVFYHAGQGAIGGAKILQDRIGTRSYQKFKHTAKKLEEVILSCSGRERVELLRQLLVLLKGVKQTSGNSEEATTIEKALVLEPREAPLILFSETDFEGNSMNFRDVFLHSQALECITLSMILDAPTEEEGLLLLDIFGLCLTGHKEVHNAISDSLRQLAKAFSSYHDEVLVKREELLQFAQSAISGVKLNTYLTRIDEEASSFWKRIDGMKASFSDSNESCKHTSVKTDSTAVEGMKEALAEVQLCCKLEELILEKKSINNGDSVEMHTEKVSKLKILAESLANSSAKAEMRISDHRHQLEEAINFRVAKASEVNENEKVNIPLKAALLRMKKHKEERNHFDEASNQIILHLKLKENELSKSIDSFKVEAATVHAWIKFLEEMWTYRSMYTNRKEKQTNEELDKYGNCFRRLIKHHLIGCKEEMRSSVHHIKALADGLKSFNERSEKTSNATTNASTDLRSRNSLEKEYLVSEEKIVTALGVADHMKLLFHSARAQSSRRDDPEIKELFDDIEKTKAEYGSVERPRLELEAPKLKAVLSWKKSFKKDPSRAANAADSPKSKRSESPEAVSTARAHQLCQGAELSEFVDAIGDWSNEDIAGWEHD